MRCAVRPGMHALDLDDFIRPFEDACSRHEHVDLKAFLPEIGHLLYSQVLRELVRIDLERHWASGRRRFVEAYQESFPELFRDPEGLRAIAFEEYRLRRQAGDEVTPIEYNRRLGVALAVGSIPQPSSRPRQPIAAMPEVGSEFLGFRLVALLGSGSFGRVYLCRQDELADRLVVLKIAPHLFDEPRALARLQHPHIAPIYSVHETPTLQAVCMPFLGTTTFADLLQDVRRQPALPSSGKFIMDRLEERSGAWAASVGRPGERSDGLAPAGEPVPLASQSYVEAVLWLAARLADGLVHAHGRGIIHRDLKPANILLTNTGHPMLLDFNLSVDHKHDHAVMAARVAGTLPYMAPEQLSAMTRGDWMADEQTDVFSFGIILCELLTGRELARCPSGPGADALDAMLAERCRPPMVCSANAAVSPGTESIVRRCLEPDPCRRYQSARELCDDLRRQVEHRPLRHALEPSRSERVRKWVRRHPRLSVAMGVGVVAAVMVIALAGAFLTRINHLAVARAERETQYARLRATAARRQLHDDLESIEFLLGPGIPGTLSEQRSEGMALAQINLDRYQVLQSLDWKEQSLMIALSPDEREQVREDMGELLLLVAGRDSRRGNLELAARLNGLAESCFRRDQVPRALWWQCAELARLAGNLALAQTLAARAAATPLQSARNRLLLLFTEYSERQRTPRELSAIKDATRLEKDNFAVWLILGNNFAEVGNRDEAIECYDRAAAVRPGSHWPYLCQGLACLERNRYREARAAFDEVIRLQPEFRECYYNRALRATTLAIFPERGLI